jgi:hypothetical protein
MGEMPGITDAIEHMRRQRRAGAPPISRPSKSERSDMAASAIHIEPTTIRGERGQYYRVHYEGAPLIEETWNPEFEACRALLARGIVGRLEVWRFGKSHPDMLVPDIAKAAELAVVENESHGPRFVRWKPKPDDVRWNAVSLSALLPPAADAASDPVLPRKETEPAEAQQGWGRK